MLSPIQLPLQPSCFEALSWSPDGEIAVAAGEHVHVLIPKNVVADPGAQGKDAWEITRIRVNNFTNAEWASIYPQNRDDFSLGAEQSMSTVIGLAWSPEGLARFRRSVLAVLTSNLILSLWEPVGPQAIWTRVAIANHALHPDPSAPGQLTGGQLRKANIRSFQWCPPLKIPGRPDGSNSAWQPESRWGVHLISVANDANEVILLKVCRFVCSPPSTWSYRVEKLASHQLNAETVRFSKISSESMLRKALELKARVLSVSTGPWLACPQSTEDNAHSVTAALATAYGQQLRLVKMAVVLRSSTDDQGDALKYQVSAELSDHPINQSSSRWAHCQVHSPLKWIYTEKASTIGLAVGTIAGFMTISMTPSNYMGSDGKTDVFDFRKIPSSSFPAAVDDEPSRRYWDPITAMSTLVDEQTNTCTLHLGSGSGLCATTTLEHLKAGVSPGLPRWSKHVDNFREQFGLDHDLGGNTVSRIGGLASYRDVIAVLITPNPTDEIQYIVTSDEKSFLGFAFEGVDQNFNANSLFTPRSNEETQPGASKREKAVEFLISQYEKGDDINEMDQRLIYAAACCSIVDEQSESIRTRARKVLERLAIHLDADLSEEISKCEAGPPQICAKTSDQFARPGGHLFEKCDICDASIPWESPDEAQCENGHLFARCGITFQAMQQPGLSKYCSGCQTEYIDEELLVRVHDEPLGPVLAKVTQAFDTCLHCNAKFKCKFKSQ
ncbi:hypothetical protein N7532_012099 [Penicillium argentinense]|uniref:Transcription factor IIIC 90kDa subunit N-terminal domain-containing protein n=1 Tax=Penicillium argentinense TaxID=1131581 RepID=A0A9W9JVM8_9EURO|nr:uncharacterized protein N7532_012099 [Penicillium argentinense]KAJ5083056.1 hypothetical protein N7532_012099 [Penicillium argentinense]